MVSKSCFLKIEAICHKSAFLADIAKTNGRKLSEAQKKEISDILDKLDNDHSEKLNFTHMFKKGHIQKTLILILCW